MCSEFTIFVVSFFYVDERSCFAGVKFNALIELFGLKRLYASFMSVFYYFFFVLFIFFFFFANVDQNILVPNLTPQYIAIQV